MESPRTRLFKSNLKTYLEIVLPVILHLFDLSIVEVLIHARFIYPVSHDFASVCFVLSLALVFSHYHKKMDPKQNEFSLMQFGNVSLFN